MSAATLLLLLGCMSPGAAIIALIWRLGARTTALPVTAALIDELSVDRYHPMSRLLDDTELRFLCSRSGVTPKLAAQFRRQRSLIFRGYLRSLTTDFTRVSAALKLVMAQAGSDRPDLASLLIRSQFPFAAGMVLVHVQPLLYTSGLGTVNVAALLKLLENMRIQLRTLIPGTVDSAA